MKKILATLALVVALCGSMVFAACGDIIGNNTNDGDDQKQEQPNDNKPNDNKPGGNENEGDNTENEGDNGNGNEDNTENEGGVKIEGTITRGTTFSNGLAFVQTDDTSKAYCINKDGYIVFELDVPSGDYIYIHPMYLEFTGDYALIPWSGALCDTKGNLTYPEDVGATTFYDVALEGGYIIANKITSTFSSTKQELGVMNTNFEWVIEPSEELYNAVKVDVNWHFSGSYYFGDYNYCDGSKVYLNLKTGEISETIEGTLPSQAWTIYTDNTYRDLNENVLLDLSEYENICDLSNFVNGKAVVCFYNRSANKSYFTIIDEKGEFQFDPVEVRDITEVTRCFFDGETVMMDDDFLGVNVIVSYNTNGEYLGTLKTETLDGRNRSYICRGVVDGVICIESSYNFSNIYHYFNPDFTPLF